MDIRIDSGSVASLKPDDPSKRAAENWSRVEALYHAARELDDDQRGAFLDVACASDTTLRREVESLLAQPVLDSFLRPGAWMAAMNADAQPTASLVGRRVGPYELTALLGEGGMGAVYRATDSTLKREVAVKVLPADVAALPARITRFQREAEILAGFNHINIAHVYGLAVSDGITALVMELVDGEDLSARIAARALSVSEALKIAEQVARALEAAHAHGIVHRDLKPGNIRLRADGIVKVLDFGLAKSIAPDSSAFSTVTAISTPGAIMGTPAYMSPEQARGAETGHETDVWAFGVVLYEMLTGVSPFARPTSTETLAQVLTAPLDESLLPPDTPGRVRRLIHRCLERDPARRWRHIGDVCIELEAVRTSAARRGVPHARWLIAGAAAAVVVAIGLGGWTFYKQRRVDWARSEGLPEIARLLSEGQGLAAFDLAQQVGAIIPSDPEFQQAWAEAGPKPMVVTDPGGAEIYIRELGAGEKPWRRVGTSPLSNTPLPRGYFLWKAVKTGFAETTGAAPTWWATVALRLAPEGKVPDGMVLVPAADTLGGDLGIPSVAGPGEPYFIDQHEVTNRQFKQFVDQGGYQKPEYWKVPFVRDGRAVSWKDAMAAFRDTTGRPGPSTWEGGTYVAGRDDFPVTGVSWYEAAAYAAFAGKSLPTLAHWYLAADIRLSPLLIPASNFSAKGPASVGSYQSIGPFGTYDMAGNAEEWAWNEADGGSRFILGGGWSSPTFQFSQPDAKAPFHRGAANGFRCVLYPTPPRASLLGPVRRSFRDYSVQKPVGDEAFAVIRGAYAYAPRELKPAIDEADDSSPYWRKEKVSFAAAYDDERMTAFLFLPKNAKPPYQALVYHPGGGATSSTFASMDGLNRIEFIIRSGRAVLYPIYIGTFNRRLPAAKSAIELKERTVKRVQDLRQSVEYLVSRDDIDASKLGYLGASWGSASAPVMVSIEERLRTAVLFEGGLYQSPAPPPEIDSFNFLPHVRIPVLMLNGRYDYTFPLESSQKPFVRWLGTPEKDKRHVVSDAAHDVMVNRTEVVREVLAWLDQYLGPVAR